MRTYFESPELRLVTVSIAEKGYATRGADGAPLPEVAADMASGPASPLCAIGIVASLLFARFEAGAPPLALVSTDNFSRNGQRFRESVLEVVGAWVDAGLASRELLEYVSDEGRVSFPWTMVDRIWKEMEDVDLVVLIRHLGCDEDLPVVADPKVIDPHAFIEELLTKRLPNRSLPDAPQRIVSDTSQKVSIRYGHTLNAYAKAGRDVSALTYIPLVIAGWLRYLLAVDDEGNEFVCSPDPLLDELQANLADVKPGCTDAALVHEAVTPILSNAEIFDCNLYDLGLGEKIEGLFLEELAGTGAVRATIKKYL